jgi:hypothetical protein
MELETCRQEVGPLLRLVADFFFRGEPQKLGHLLVLLNILVEVADDAHPCLVALGLEQHGVSDLASELAHARTDDAPPQRCRRSLALPWGCILLGHIVCVCIIVDPFPGVVLVAKLVVGIFTEHSAACEVLPCFVRAGAFDGSHELAVEVTIGLVEVLT